MNNEERLLVIKREAKATVLALIVLIAFWCFLGFFLADVEIKIFHLPLWAVTGILGTWEISSG